jgi:uncharacterized membrane protein YfcA
LEKAQMNFSISGVHINPFYLATMGFVVGILGGFFGVGGSFLAGPALFGFGVPMNFVVGTDLAHIVGKSIVAARKHYTLGNIDLRLGMWMLIGTLPGVEVGAQLIQLLKHVGHIDAVVGIIFILVLLSVSGVMAVESWRAIKKRTDGKPGEKKTVFFSIANKLHKLNWPPYVKLKVSGIRRVSLWPIIAVSFIGGLFSGFLGGGAGYIRMPFMIYLLGIPTHIAVGTDLFEIIFSAGYGVVTHALKGNVDILIALVMHTGGAVGAQIGATLSQYISGARIRLAFIPLPLIGIAIILHGLLKGHGAK